MSETMYRGARTTNRFVVVGPILAWAAGASADPSNVALRAAAGVLCSVMAQGEPEMCPPIYSAACGFVCQPGGWCVMNGGNPVDAGRPVGSGFAAVANDSGEVAYLFYSPDRGTVMGRITLDLTAELWTRQGWCDSMSLVPDAIGTQLMGFTNARLFRHPLHEAPEYRDQLFGVGAARNAIAGTGLDDHQGAVNLIFSEAGSAFWTEGTTYEPYAMQDLIRSWAGIGWYGAPLQVGTGFDLDTSRGVGLLVGDYGCLVRGDVQYSRSAASRFDSSDEISAWRRWNNGEVPGSGATGWFYDNSWPCTGDPCIWAIGSCDVCNPKFRSVFVDPRVPGIPGACSEAQCDGEGQTEPSCTLCQELCDLDVQLDANVVHIPNDEESRFLITFWFSRAGETAFPHLGALRYRETGRKPESATWEYRADSSSGWELLTSESIDSYADVGACAANASVVTPNRQGRYLGERKVLIVSNSTACEGGGNHLFEILYDDPSEEFSVPAAIDSVYSPIGVPHFIEPSFEMEVDAGGVAYLVYPPPDGQSLILRTKLSSNGPKEWSDPYTIIENDVPDTVILPVAMGFHGASQRPVVFYVRWSPDDKEGRLFAATPPPSPGLRPCLDVDEPQTPPMLNAQELTAVGAVPDAVVTFGQPALDRDGFSYAPNTGGFGVRVFSPDGSSNVDWPGPGGGGSHVCFLWPTGVALDHLRQEVYVAERDVACNSLFGPCGTVNVIPMDLRDEPTSQCNTALSLTPGPAYPGDVSVDEVRRRLYVSSTLLHRVEVYDLDPSADPLVRQHLYGVGQTGEVPYLFNLPYGHDVDEDGNLYVVDSGNHRVAKFVYDAPTARVIYDESRGSWTRGTPGQGALQFASPLGVAVDDAYERVYVADTLNKRVQVLTKSGAFVHQWGSWVRQGVTDRFLNPVGVAVGDNSRVYVTGGEKPVLGELLAQPEFEWFKVPDDPPSVSVFNLAPCQVVSTGPNLNTGEVTDDWGAERVVFEVIEDGVGVIHQQTFPITLPAIPHTQPVPFQFSWALGSGPARGGLVKVTVYDVIQQKDIFAQRVVLRGPDPGTDGDFDGLSDLCDNCPQDANNGQEDCDYDGKGNRCTILECPPNDPTCRDCNDDGVPAGCGPDGNNNEILDECEWPLYVDADAASGGDGLTWGTAYKKLEDALDHAREIEPNVRQIWVAEGNYNSPNITDAQGAAIVGFQMVAGVGLYGGFAGTESSLALRDWTQHNTNLRGQQPPLEARFVMVIPPGAGPDTVIDGFTVENGSASLFGGGIVNLSGGSPTIGHCTFAANASGQEGGAIYTSNGSPIIHNCVFRGNSADFFGGGILHTGTGSPRVINCTFAENLAIEPDVSAGAGATSGGPSLQIVNCVFWENDAAGATGAAAQIWAKPGAGQVPVDHSVVEGWPGALQGVESIGDDPLFLNLAMGDLHLQTPSPCRDEGRDVDLPSDSADLDGDGNAEESDPYDLDRTPRLAGCVVDMGAYELPAPANGPCQDVDVCTFDCCVVGESCRHESSEYGDVTCDSSTNPPCVSCTGTQCGHDGFVNVQDLLAVLDAFAGTLVPGCFPHNFDIAGSIPQCAPDGFVGVPDALAVLDAIAGNPACCGGESMMSGPMFEPPSESGFVDLAFHAVVDQPGEMFIDVFVQSSVPLRAYELSFEIMLAGESVEVVGVEADDSRPDYVFAGNIHYSAFDPVRKRLLVVSVAAGGGQGAAYVGTARCRLPSSSPATGLTNVSVSLTTDSMIVDEFRRVLSVTGQDTSVDIAVP